LCFGVEPAGRDVQTITEAYLASFPRAAQALRGVPPPGRDANPRSAGEQLAEPAEGEPLVAMDLVPARQS
jgi:hypothetical protein